MINLPGQKPNLLILTCESSFIVLKTDWLPDLADLHHLAPQYLSHLMREPTICIGENKGADQLRGNREADQRLCFRYLDSTIPHLLKFEISSFWLFSLLVQVGLCRTCSETTLLVS